MIVISITFQRRDLLDVNNRLQRYGQTVYAHVDLLAVCKCLDSNRRLLQEHVVHSAVRDHATADGFAVTSCVTDTPMACLFLARSLESGFDRLCLPAVALFVHQQTQRSRRPYEKLMNFINWDLVISAPSRPGDSSTP